MPNIELQNIELQKQYTNLRDNFYRFKEQLKKVAT